jgi:hypothetical protein
MSIYYTDKNTDESGHIWFTINGDTSYDLNSGWTEETARADYESPEHAEEDYVSTMRAFGACED